MGHLGDLSERALRKILENCLRVYRYSLNLGMCDGLIFQRHDSKWQSLSTACFGSRSTGRRGRRRGRSTWRVWAPLKSKMPQGARRFSLPSATLRSGPATLAAPIPVHARLPQMTGNHRHACMRHSFWRSTAKDKAAICRLVVVDVAGEQIAAGRGIARLAAVITWPLCDYCASFVAPTFQATDYYDNLNSNTRNVT